MGQMAAHRVQVLLSREEKARLQAQAARDGFSLSRWVREAALEKLETASGGQGFRSAAELDAFFASTREAEPGREPDWVQHLDVIERSRASGGSGT